MRLINVDRRKLARGPKSKQPHEPHAARYVSHFHASGELPLPINSLFEGMFH